jgi:hypothetical protein
MVREENVLDCRRKIKYETVLALFLVRIKTVVRPNFRAELLHDGDAQLQSRAAT